MSKEELKTQYHLGKISSKDYFKRLAEIFRMEHPASVPDKSVDFLADFDGKLPLFKV